MSNHRVYFKGKLVFKIILLNFLVFCFFQVKATERIEVKIYAYHLKPPFIIDKNKRVGLYYDFSRYLNLIQKQFHFKTIFMPRKRIELLINNEKLEGILIGVSPIWFKDKNQTRFLWTHSIFDDQDEIVSLIKTPFDFQGPHSLSGKTLAGVLGFSYFGIDEWVNKGEIKRDDTIGEKQVLLKILHQRADVGIVSRSTLNYILPKEGWENKFYISPLPHDIYQRKILIPHKYHSVYQAINPITKNMASDEQWLSLTKHYQ